MCRSLADQKQTDKNRDSAEALFNLFDSLRLQKAYLGLSEQIDHVLALGRNPPKDIKAAQEVLHFALCNGLYIEKYLNIHKQ